MLPVADQSSVLFDLALRPGRYAVLTMHRPSSVDDDAVLRAWLRALVELSRRLPIVFPVHPRTRERIENLDPGDGIPLWDGHAAERIARVLMGRRSTGDVLSPSTSLGTSKVEGMNADFYVFYLRSVPQERICVNLRPREEWDADLRRLRSESLGAVSPVGRYLARLFAREYNSN